MEYTGRRHHVSLGVGEHIAKREKDFLYSKWGEGDYLVLFHRPFVNRLYLLIG